MADYERTTFFDVYGPVDVARSDGRVTGAQAKLWEAFQASGCEPGAIGCYMFCLKTGTSLRPWYVGMTVAQKGFKGEAFTPHKLAAYNEVLDAKRGQPVMFLFPLLTPTDQFARPGANHKRLIQWLEKYLMMTAFARNPAISNIRDMKFLRQVEVLGVLGKRQGRPHHQVTQVRRALFGQPNRLEE